MSLFLYACAALAIFAVLYALWLRPWLKRHVWAQGFFAWIEPIEVSLYKKSETILVGRVLEFGGLFVTAYDGLAAFATSLDLTPITTRALDALHVAPDLRGLAVTAFVAFLGRVITWLRAQTTRPLELVAAPEANLSVAASAAIAQADAAKDQAVRLVAGG